MRERRVSAPEEPPSKVSKSTSNSYRIYQKRFQRWCLERGTNDIIDQDKLAGFLQSLSERPNRYDPKKKIGYPTLAQATSALCILYREQFERGINPNPNPRDENVNLILSNARGATSASSPARRKRGRPARMSAPQPSIDRFINSPAGRVATPPPPGPPGTSPSKAGSSPLSSPQSSGKGISTIAVGSEVPTDNSWRTAISPQDMEKLVKTSYARSARERKDMTITMIPESARNRAYMLFGYKTQVDCNVVATLKLTDLDALVPSENGPTVFAFNLNRDRTRAASNSEYLYAVREKDPRFCFIGALAWYIFVRFQVLDEALPNPSMGKFYWYREFLFKRHTPGNSSLVKQLLVLFDDANIEMPGFLQEAKFGKKGEDDFDLERLGHPANVNEDLAKQVPLLPFGSNPVRNGQVRALEFARTSVEPSESLQQMVFSKLDDVEREVTDMYSRDDPESRDDAALGFIRFMKEMRKVILQDAAAVIDYHRNDTLFNADVFHTKEFAQFAKELRQKAGIDAPFKLSGPEKDLSDYEDVDEEMEEGVLPAWQAVAPSQPEAESYQAKESKNPLKRKYVEDDGTSEQLKLLNENTTMLRNQLAQTSTDLRGVMDAVTAMKRDIDVLKQSKAADQSMTSMTNFLDRRVADLTRELTTSLNRSIQQIATSSEQGRSGSTRPEDLTQAMNNEMMAQYMAMMRSNPYYGYQANMWWPQYGYMPSPVQPQPHEMTPQQQPPPPQQQQQQQPPPPPPGSLQQSSPQQGPPPHPQQQQPPPPPPPQQQQPPPQYQQQPMQPHQPLPQHQQLYPGHSLPPNQQHGMAPSQQAAPSQIPQEMQQAPGPHHHGAVYYPPGGGHPMYAQVGPNGAPVYVPHQYVAYQQPPPEEVQRQMVPSQPPRERRRSQLDPPGEKVASKHGAAYVRKVQKVPLVASKTSPRREEAKEPDTAMAHSNAESSPKQLPSRSGAQSSSDKSPTVSTQGNADTASTQDADTPSTNVDTGSTQGKPDTTTEEKGKSASSEAPKEMPAPNATIEEITIESSDREDEGEKNGSATATSGGSAFGSAMSAIAAAAANLADKAKSTSPHPPAKSVTNDEGERQTD